MPRKYLWYYHPTSNQAFSRILTSQDVGISWPDVPVSWKWLPQPTLSLDPHPQHPLSFIHHSFTNTKKDKLNMTRGKNCIEERRFVFIPSQPAVQTTCLPTSNFHTHTNNLLHFLYLPTPHNISIDRSSMQIHPHSTPLTDRSLCSIFTHCIVHPNLHPQRRIFSPLSPNKETTSRDHLLVDLSKDTAYD